MVGTSIEGQTAALFPKLSGGSAKKTRKSHNTSSATLPTICEPFRGHVQTTAASRQSLVPSQNTSELLCLPQSCREPGPKKRTDFRRSVVQSARKIRQSARKNATGVSYYTDEPVHGQDGPQGCVLDYNVPRSFAPGFGCMIPDSEDKAWMASIFQTHLPASREDVLRLRDYLETTIEQLEAETEQENHSLFTHAEQAINLYTMGFQELTRQVSLHCAERGRLMADLWTSNADMTSRVLQEMGMLKEESEATARALRMRNQVLERQVEGLQQALLDKRIQLKASKDKMNDLQKTALGHDFMGTISRTSTDE